MKRTALYRHYDAEGTLLYVGASLHPVYRQIQHHADAHWFNAVARIDVEWFDSKAAAMAAEAAAIATDRPAFNSQHSQRKRAPAKRARGSADNSEILSRIYGFIASSGETKTAFGLRVCGDYGLVGRLENGTEPRAATVAKIEAAISYEGAA